MSSSKDPSDSSFHLSLNVQVMCCNFCIAHSFLKYLSNVLYTTPQASSSFYAYLVYINAMYPTYLLSRGVMLGEPVEALHQKPEVSALI